MAEYFNSLFQQLIATPSSTRLLEHDGLGGETTEDSNHETPASSSSSGGGGGGDMGSDRFEFIAFLLWYIFLVFCCVVPTCCAYRRRRRAELRLAAQQANLNRLQHSNLFILSNLQRHSANTDRIQQERKRILTEELKATTMTLTENDLQEASPSVIGEEAAAVSESSADFENQKGGLEGKCAKEDPRPAATSTTDDNPVDAVEYAAEFDDLVEDSGIVRLPADRQNADRTVSGTCTICLCPYADGDSISWSTGSSTCLHAFHTDCVISWLAKKEEPKCPVCRQTFCATANVGEILDPSSAHHNTESSFLESFSQAFALSQFYRQQDAAYSASTPEDLEAARRASQFELRNLAMRHHMLRASVLRDAEERAAARQRALNGEAELVTAATPGSYDVPFTFRYIGRDGPSGQASEDASQHQSSSSVGTDDVPDLESGAAAAASEDPINNVASVEREGDGAVDDEDAPQDLSSLSASQQQQQH